jgi:hypothetical protein
MNVTRRQAMQMIAGAVPAVAGAHAFAAAQAGAKPQAAAKPKATAKVAAKPQVEAPVEAGVRRFVFEGVSSEMQISMAELGQTAPADLSGYTHLVMEMRMSSPQRLLIWFYTTHGPRSASIIGFGQNAWLRASMPLQYFIGRDSKGNDLASAQNRRTNSSWYSVWGPFGDLHTVESIGIAMEYPLNKPTIEIRNVHLSTKDEGSEFLDPGAKLDSFGQWALADWPRKIKSKEQLARELAAEEKAFGSPADFGYGKYGGYKNTQVKATGFFRVEKVDGRWWFVDPEGHLFLSTGTNGAPGGGAGFGGNDAGATVKRTNARLDSWGMTTGGQGRPGTVMLRWPQSTSFLGMPDVYSAQFVAEIDAAANTQCTPHKNDPLVLGYFIGNEPPWNAREAELCGLILGGPATATQAKLKEFLAGGDTAARRREFVLACFQWYLGLVCGAVRKYDPNHLLLGTRYGGTMADEYFVAARIFDVCSINVYEYEPTRQIIHAARLCERPILIGEYHIGVPADGLAAGLVQAASQLERGVAYRYYVEQAASLEWFLGAYWFAWRDEPVMGRMDGENYNIGFVDVTDRPYAELVEAAKVTHKRLQDVHAGKVMPFARHPMASAAGAPSTPWPLGSAV